VTSRPDSSFAERLPEIGVLSMRAFRLGMFDVDQMTPAALGFDLEPSEVMPLCMFNLMASAPAEFDGELADGQLPELHWEPVFSNIRSGCYLRVYDSTVNTIRLRLRAGGLSREIVEGILLGIHQRVIGALDDEQPSI
jgi:hypothetical protein